MARINLQPVLYGRILKLRPIKAHDFEELYQAASDKLIWEQHPQPQRIEKSYFKDTYFKTGLQSNSCLVALNNRQELIGCSRYYNYRPQHNDIAIGYTFLTRDYWGTSANRQMKHLMFTHIFEWVDNILIIIASSNLRSRKAIEKIGAQLLSAEQLKQKDLNLLNKVVFQVKKQNFNGLL